MRRLRPRHCPKPRMEVLTSVRGDNQVTAGPELGGVLMSVAKATAMCSARTILTSRAPV